MSTFVDALAWILDPGHWGGSQGIGARLAQHLAVTVAAVLVAALPAVPLGILIGHTRRGRGVVVALAGAVRAVPTLGLLTLLALLLGVGVEAPLLALVALAVPSLLAGAYAGVESADPAAVDAARAMGMTELQIVRHVEVPLGAGIIVGGLRAATLQVVATATLAAYTSDTGLGRYLFSGLKSRDYTLMLAGAVLVALLALVLDRLLAVAQNRASRLSRRTAADARLGA